MPAAGALVVGKKLAMQKAVAAKKSLAAKKAAAKKIDKNKLLKQKKGGGGEEDDSSSIVVREKSTTLSAPLLGGDDSSDSSSNTSKKSKSPLDRIDSAVKDIMKTLKKRRKLMLNKSRRMRVQDDKRKKGKREGLLEKMKTTGKNMVKSAAAGAKGWWERLQKFLLMTMLGALVKSIVDNWKSIKAQIDKVVKFVQDLWKFMEPVITPLIEGLKWVVKQWSEMSSELMGLGKDKPKVEKETDQLSQDLKELEKKKDWVTGKFKEAEQGVKDMEGKKFGDLADEAGLSDKVSPDSEGRSEVSKEQVEEQVGGQITESDIENKLNEFKSKVEEVNPTVIKVDPEKLKQYEEGAVPVPETGPAVVHKGEVIIPAPVVKQVGGPMNVVKFMEIGLGGGTEGLGALTESAKTKTISSAVGDFFSGDDGESKRLKEDTNRGSVIADLSEHLPPKMMEKMEKTLTAINEQTEYEDPSASTIIIRVPTSAPQSGGGGGEGKTIVVPVGSTPKDTLNRYVNAVIQKALF